jgi:hypothetical protein
VRALYRPVEAPPDPAGGAPPAFPDKIMDPNKRETQQISLIDRFRKAWFPPAAVVGSLGAFAAAALRGRPAVNAAPRPESPAAPPAPLTQLTKLSTRPQGMTREYSLSTVIGAARSATPFRLSLTAVAVGPGDRIYALADNEIRVFEPSGMFLRSWMAPDKAACLAIAADQRIYVGSGNRVEIFNANGEHTGEFAIGEAKQAVDITAIKLFQGNILVADAAARIIRRFDASGKPRGVIGDKNKTGSFILPNKSLDIDVDGKGVVRATDTGRHQVSSWTIEGAPLGIFGKFGMTDPADFVGCCNPVNLSTTPDGKIVTGEKMVARVKVYDPDGKLLAVIGPEHFDPNCVHIHLAVDSKGRILAADPGKREIMVFSLTWKNEPAEPRRKEPEQL